MTEKLPLVLLDSNSNSLSELTIDNESAKWVDCGEYYIYDAEQRTPPWKRGRIGRLSGSQIGSCVGHAGYPNAPTPNEKAKEIAGLYVKQFTPKEQARMDYGTLKEPDARRWYEKKFNVKVYEVGLVVPKFNPYFGYSTDGIPSIIGNPNILSDGMIEIKCPQEMYKPLLKYLEKYGSTSGPVKNFKESKHIWQTHYDQMTLGMRVFGKKWCDYIVYCEPEDIVFCQRVLSDLSYWEHILYPLSLDFIETELKPLLVNTKYPIMPPNYNNIVAKMSSLSIRSS